MIEYLEFDIKICNNSYKNFVFKEWLKQYYAITNYPEPMIINKKYLLYKTILPVSFIDIISKIENDGHIVWTCSTKKFNINDDELLIYKKVDINYPDYDYDDDDIEKINHIDTLIV